MLRPPASTLFIVGLILASGAHAAEERRDLDPFHAIAYGLSHDVVFVQGDGEYVLLEGDQSTIDEIVSEIRGGTLYLEHERSWFDFAVETLRLAGDATPVDPCTTEEFPRPAPRPGYSVLDCEKLGRLRGRRMAPWKDALADFLRAEGLLG